MSSKISTTKYTPSYSAQIEDLAQILSQINNVIIGAGAGLSTSAGLTYSGKRFTDAFPDFIQKFGLTDMYSSAFYEFPDLETKWAYWSRHVFMNGYNYVLNDTYDILFDLIKDKNYFVLTTNADHAFLNHGFDRKRLFYTQGDYQLFQCSVPCVQETFKNQFQIVTMVKFQKDMRVPTKMLPKCPYCDAPAISNLRIDDTFAQPPGWYAAQERYEEFLLTYSESKPILYLELGVGLNTPGIIKYPFWHYTKLNNKATYVSINLNEVSVPSEITDQSICITHDIHDALHDLKKIYNI